MARKHPQLQFVWPKEGEKGSRKRGFFRGFTDIITGKGPDMFLQKSGRTTAIRADRWGNWDSYHWRDAHDEENLGPNTLFRGRRGHSRYDPIAREYVEWGHPDDWDNEGIRNHGPLAVPRFTEEERRKMRSRVQRGSVPNPFRMGDEWSNIGPKRWRPENNWFWDSAHRIGTNRWDGADVNDPPYTYRWGQVSRTDLWNYVNQQFN